MANKRLTQRKPTKISRIGRPKNPPEPRHPKTRLLRKPFRPNIKNRISGYGKTRLAQTPKIQQSNGRKNPNRESNTNWVAYKEKQVRHPFHRTSLTPNLSPIVQKNKTSEKRRSEQSQPHEHSVGDVLVAVGPSVITRANRQGILRLTLKSTTPSRNGRKKKGKKHEAWRANNSRLLAPVANDAPEALRTIH